MLKVIVTKKECARDLYWTGLRKHMFSDIVVWAAIAIETEIAIEGKIKIPGAFCFGHSTEHCSEQE
jgi:hypothetical protein